MKSVKDKVLKVAEVVSDKIGGSAYPIGDHLKNLSEQLKSSAISVGDFFQKYVPEFLTNEDFYRKMVGQMNDTFHHHKENPAIKAVIDGMAHAKEAGGPLWHRMADGRHTFSGAMDALESEFPDMPYFEKAIGTFQHLSADMNSISGIPLWQFNSIEEFKDFCENMNLPKSVVADFLSVNSTELLSSALTIIPSLYNFTDMQSEDFARLAARLGVLTVGGSQFEALSSMFALFALGQSFFLASNEDKNISSVLLEIGVEGGFTTAVVASSAFLPFPASLVMPLVVTGFKQRVYQDGFEAAFEDYQSSFLSLKDTISEIDFGENIEKFSDFVTGIKSA